MATIRSLVLVTAGLVLSSIAVFAFPSASELAERFAPVVHQRAASDQDYLTAFNFDRNWNGRDNWERQEWGYVLRGTVYHAVVQTPTHVYVTYLFYHPRQWNRINTRWWSHEHDLTALRVVAVREDPQDLGQPVSVETVNSGEFAFYAVAEGVELKDGNFEGVAHMEGTHPVVSITSKSHRLSVVEANRSAPSKGIRYHFTGRAKEPRSPKDSSCEYALVDITQTLWARRDQTGEGRPFSQPGTTAYGDAGMAFNGDNYKPDAVATPWAWDNSPAGPVAEGDWLLDPAFVFSEWYESDHPVARGYLHNPFDGPAPENAEMAMAEATRADRFHQLYDE